MKLERDERRVVAAQLTPAAGFLYQQLLHLPTSARDGASARQRLQRARSSAPTIDERACLEYLEHLRWPQGFRCPLCNRDTYWWTRRGLLVCRACERQTHVHRIAGLVKRWLLGTYQGSVQPRQLDDYLDEYCFRFNRR